jgi:myo-inositol-1(or 4)-monophosphatase
MKFLNPILYSATKIVLKAGKIIHSGFIRRDMKVSIKADQSLVTNYDLLAEKIISEDLKTYYPDHHFFGEETNKPNSAPVEGYAWYCDPIDGTHNFIKGMPYFCISLAMQFNGITEIGIVYNPATNELYIGSKGEGVTCNDRRIKISDLHYPYQSTVITNNMFNSHYIEKIKQMGFEMRSPGASALDIAASLNPKCLSFTYYKAMHHYDVMAGIFLVEEAGGLVVNKEKKKVNLNNEEIILAGEESEIRRLLTIFN